MARIAIGSIVPSSNRVVERTTAAILIWSTNLPGLDAMAPLEAELGIPVLDSAATGLAGLLAAAGVATAGLSPLGRGFAAP